MVGVGRRGHLGSGVIIDEGAVPASDMSMQAIAAWLADHPDQVRRVMSANPSYVFFRELDGGDAYMPYWLARYHGFITAEEER